MKEAEELTIKCTGLEEVLSQRNEAIDTYKQKIVSLELADEEKKKKSDALALQVQSLLKQLHESKE